jgi:hypothetical protein
MKECKGNFKGRLMREIDASYQDYESFFERIDMNDLDLSKKIEEVNSLIEHVNNRIHYTETRLGRTVTFAVTLIAVGIGCFAASVKLDGLSFYFGLVGGGLLILTGIITTLINVFQTNPRYPFRKLQNDWKWFYPRIIDEKYKPGVIMKEGEREYLEKRLLHVKGLKKYAENIVTETPVERLKIDIQQLYLLHVNEKYKNKFLTNLRWILSIGVSLALFAFIGLFVAISVDKIRDPQADASGARGYAGQARPEKSLERQRTE